MATADTYGPALWIRQIERTDKAEYWFRRVQAAVLKDLRYWTEMGV